MISSSHEELNGVWKLYHSSASPGLLLNPEAVSHFSQPKWPTIRSFHRSFEPRRGVSHEQSRQVQIAVIVFCFALSHHLLLLHRHRDCLHAAKFVHLL